MPIENAVPTDDDLREHVPLDAPAEATSLSGAEATFAQSTPTGYAAARTAADFLPLLWAMFPSGRERFANLSPGGKALHLGIDVATLGGIGLAGKSLKVLLRTIKNSEKLGFNVAKKKGILDSLANLEKELPVKFELGTPATRLKDKYKLTDAEVDAVMEKKLPKAMWQPSGRGDALRPLPPRKKLQNMFTKKGNLTKGVSDDLEYWKSTPPVEQARDFYSKQWKKTLKEDYGSKGVVLDPDRLFAYQAEKYFGETGKDLTFKNIGARDMAALWKGLLEDRRDMLKVLDIGYKYVTPTIFLPSRKVYGAGEIAHGTYTQWKKTSKLFENENKYLGECFSKLHHKFAKAGLVSIKVAKGDKEKIKLLASPDSWREYGKLAVKLDDMAASGVDNLERIKVLASASDEAQKFYGAHREWHDDLYKQFFAEKAIQVFELEGINSRGLTSLNKLLVGPKGKPGVLKALDDIVGSEGDYKLKSMGIEKLLGTLREVAEPQWFTGLGPKGFLKKKEALAKKFQTGRKGSLGEFPSYTENYSIRLDRHNKGQVLSRAGALKNSKNASFVKARLTDPSATRVVDASSLLETRARAQARELTVRPYLKESNEFFSKLPEGYKNYYDHWVSRMLGETSVVDHHMAQWLTSTVGKTERWFGKEGVWDAHRVRDLGKRVNDMVYLGALGFKPFSAIKNAFQSLVTVPTDLGGVKDFYWLAKGINFMSKKANRKYAESMGIIREYAPEIYNNPQTVRVGTKFLGKELPQMQTVRDAGMFMFQGTDQFSRHWTAGAAISKWEHHAKKFLVPGNMRTKQFADKMKFHGRDSWVRKDLEEILFKIPKDSTNSAVIKPALEEVKKLFVNDVVADTQWLYGLADAPMISQRFGVISKTGTIFQTWWMNYLAGLEKWFFRTDLNNWEKINRGFTWMSSSALAYYGMIYGTGFTPRQAQTTVGFGPMPEGFSEFSIPPTVAPLYHAIDTVASIGKLEDPDTVKRKLNSLWRSTEIFIPGGLQASQMIRGAKKDGMEGFARSITGYHLGED